MIRTTVLAVLLALVGCKTTGSAPIYLIKVEKGDTLASIAVKYDTTWDAISKLNNLKGAPRVGQVLRVAPGPGGLVAGAGRASAEGNADLASEDEFPDVQRADAGGKHGLFFGGGAGPGGKTGTALDWPLYGEISSPYGQRNGKFHHGIDIRVKKGTTVLAAGTGVVEFAGNQHGYGKVLIIRHASCKSVYAHLNSIDVQVGDHVTHATPVAETGVSGNSTGPHLHFEIRTLKDQSVDPLSVLSKEKLVSYNK
jgi:murein DD-endopeptidase MepM/ murein hydrolase activator NlpD